MPPGENVAKEFTHCEGVAITKFWDGTMHRIWIDPLATFLRAA